MQNYTTKACNFVGKVAN